MNLYFKCLGILSFNYGVIWILGQTQAQFSVYTNSLLSLVNSGKRTLNND